MKDALIVSEAFYSIQGEGITAGCPAVFLRLAGCNLLCEGTGWRCDTIEVWKHGKSTPFNEVLSIQQIAMLAKGAHLVITGGEPLLHQAAIVEFLLFLIAEHKLKPFLEIETNGTIKPDNFLLFHVNQWNVSPKLSTSGEAYSKRVNEVALKRFGHPNCDSVFKFVISSEADLFELLTEFTDLIPMKRVILMPAGSTQEELAVTRPLVAEMCKEHSLRFTDRVHVTIWNKKTGV